MGSQFHTPFEPSRYAHPRTEASKPRVFLNRDVLCDKEE